MDAGDLEVGYHYISDEGSALAPADRVEGWLVSESVSVVSGEEGDWFELIVRHGAVVQLRQRKAEGKLDGLTSRMPEGGQLLVYFLMAGLLGVVPKRRTRRSPVG